MKRQGANALRCLQMAVAIRRSGAIICAPGFSLMPDGLHPPKKAAAPIPRQSRLLVCHCPLCGLFLAAGSSQKPLDTILCLHMCPEISPVWGTHSQMSFKLHHYLTGCIGYQGWLLHAPTSLKSRVAIAILFLERRADRSVLQRPMRGCICVTPDRARQTHGRGMGLARERLAESTASHGQMRGQISAD